MFEFLPLLIVLTKHDYLSTRKNLLLHICLGHWFKCKYGELFNKNDVHTKLLYCLISKVSNSLRISNLGFQGRDKWLAIPDIGYPIAYRDVIILDTLSKKLKIAFLSLGLSPSMTAYQHKFISFYFVNKYCHWI